MSLHIAITQRVVKNASYAERRDALSQEWASYLHDILPEAILVPLPNHPGVVAKWVEAIKIDGAILSGGNSWGEAPERDATELELIACCRAAMIPLLGVCRGIQVLNKLFGGKVQPDLMALNKTGHVACNHKVKLTGSPFIGFADGRSDIITNSFHDCGILQRDVAPQLIPFAETDDGVVEGIFHKNEPIIALQWHPERVGQCADFDRQLIKKLFRNGKFWTDLQKD
ncbi:MAG: gamma-glutamyl-gamma-aminobutyrate hydrolase family protein [Magnetococcales bacterium]|nr:gamma-glutamyl-gamma-aminobutyrate hydrolase family protein [Magnetococcales bacterium]